MGREPNLDEASRVRRELGMTVGRGFAIVLTGGVGFAAGGGGVGYLLARVAPAYYRGVFAGGHVPGFDPVQVGVGLGIAQGLIAGLVVGTGVVLAVALAGRRCPGGAPERCDDPGRRPGCEAGGQTDHFSGAGQA